MVTFELVGDNIIFTYNYTSYSNSDWFRNVLKEKGFINYKSTFYFIEEDIYISEDKLQSEDLIDDLEFDLFDIEFKPVSFVFADLIGDYFKIKRGILDNSRDVYFYKEIDLSLDYFVAEKRISLFKKIIPLITEDIYIGGGNVNSIPFDAFLDLVNSFPNNYEKDLYANARITSRIKNYFDTAVDSERKFQNYISKKKSTIGEDLNKLFKEYEILKYTTILEKLEKMLNSEDSYSENQWQNEILEIILLLYPKYILSFTSVHISVDEKKRKFLDFMLVDSNGNIDVIEIKKPFENSIMSNNFYRNNYIPHKDLTGTVMQLEKYIYHLNRWGISGERKLNEKYSDKLPEGLSIKITNPKGFIISGRENNLSEDQKSDFEVVKRKYKNVIDIITYDDLLQRLKFTIEQIKKL